MKQIILMIVLYCSFMVALGLGSYQFILKNYYSIEVSQYSKTTPSIIQSIKTQMDFVKGTAGDYAEWDDTYAFMEGENPDFIETNFRDGSNVLGTLGLDFMLYTHFDNALVYSLHKNKSADNSSFEKALFGSKLSAIEGNSFVFYNDKVFIFHRHLINNSDKTKNPNGYIYVGKVLDVKTLIKSHPEFNEISFKRFEEARESSKTQEIEGIAYSKSEEYLTNVIEAKIDIFDANGKYVWSILTSYSRDIVMQGQSTLQIFLAIVGMIVAIIFILFGRRQRSLLSEKERFELLVNERTKQLSATMEELNVAIHQLKSIAYIDSLTGIYNRRSFFEQFAPILEKANINNQEVACAMIDLDDFKKINDTYGHDVGDSVLRHFTQSCEKCLDETMLLARLGGEEFVIGFKKSSIAEAMKVCEDIQNYIEHNPAKVNKKLLVSYTVSIGIANNYYTSDIDQILKEADEKLYGSKSSGKNKIRT